MPPWATVPGRTNSGAGVLFLEAYGQLAGAPAVAGPASDKLYSVFLDRACLMTWSSIPQRTPPSTANRLPVHPLWRMEEAEVTAGGDDSRIGFVQVGLEMGVDPAIALAPMMQCFSDALDRFGIEELSGLQVTARNLEPSNGPWVNDLMGVGYWFYSTPEARANALITFDNDLLRERSESEFVSSLQQFNNEWLRFGSLVQVSRDHSIKVPVEVAPNPTPSAFGRENVGVSVTLPEWTPSAMAWVLAFVIDKARTDGPDVSNFTVRLARVG